MYKLPSNNESILFFEEYTKPENYIPSVIAVLNKCGFGTLYFGVNKLGEVIGTKYSKSTIALINKDFEKNIVPNIFPSITPLKENSNAIKVSFEGLSKPYSYKGKYYLKDHNDIRSLDYESLMREINYYDKPYFKEDEEVSANNRVIDEQLIRNTFECAIKVKKYSPKEKKFSLKNTLLNWGLTKNNKLTKAAILLFGKKLPLSITINTYNNEKNPKLIDSKFVKGNILSLLKFALPYLKDTYLEKYNIKGKDYPSKIIDEIVVNAFLHANYNYGNEIKISLTPYKISVLNPGTFPSEYLPEDFGFTRAQPIINNKLIGKILSYLGYASLNGKGYKTLFEIKKELKPFLIKQIDNEFEFTYFFYHDKNKYLSPDKAILSILLQKPFIKAEEIAIKIGKTRRTVQTILKELKEKNLITRKGSKKTGYWIVNK
ncbi:MAG: putative DNA binding domain-containing protein [Bacilli bacterium]|nr:putative DNA binding domain-containing protein [Bacilli bacterium]